MFSAADEFERRYVRPTPGRTLIVGSRVYPGRCDRRARYRDVLGVDMQAGPGVDIVADLEQGTVSGGFDHIECLSVLEHTPRPWLLCANLERMLRPGGTLHLAVPFVWRVHSYPGDYWRFTVPAVQSLFVAIRWHRLLYGNDRLRSADSRLGRLKNAEGHPYHPRTEVLGFGVRA